MTRFAHLTRLHVTSLGGADPHLHPDTVAAPDRAERAGRGAAPVTRDAARLPE